jgi:hypothetical protein
LAGDLSCRFAGVNAWAGAVNHALTMILQAKLTTKIKPQLTATVPFLFDSPAESAIRPK